MRTRTATWRIIALVCFVQMSFFFLKLFDVVSLSWLEVFYPIIFVLILGVVVIFLLFLGLWIRKKIRSGK